MTSHTEDDLAGAGVSQVVYLSLAVSAFKTGCAKSLVTGEDGEVFDLVAADIAAVCAVVAYERAIAEQEQVRIRVQRSAALIALEAMYVPSVSSWYVCQQCS